MIQEIEKIKTFREEYIEERGKCIYCFCSALVYTFCMSYLLVDQEYLGMVVLLICSLLFYFWGWMSYDKMKKAKSYIVFDDFLKDKL